MTFVILVCDPSRDNPVRTLPERDKRLRATILAGYPLEADGKRPNKNAREMAAGNNKRVEEAIIEFRKNHYDEKQDTLDALSQQVAEIREFLKADKRTPMTTSKGEIIKDDKGEPIMQMDPKVLESAAKLGEKLPGLVKAKIELEQILNLEQVNKFEGQTYTAQDLDSVEDTNLSTLDQMHLANNK